MSYPIAAAIDRLASTLKFALPNDSKISTALYAFTENQKAQAEYYRQAAAAVQNMNLVYKAALVELGRLSEEEG